MKGALVGWRTALIMPRLREQNDSRKLWEKDILLQCTCKIARTV